MIDFHGRNVIVTGAGGGLGKGLVEILSTCNARVVVCDIDCNDRSAQGVGEAHHFDLLDDRAVADFALDRMTAN